MRFKSLETAMMAFRNQQHLNFAKIVLLEDSKDRARRWMSELEEKAMDIVCNMIAAIGFEVIDAVTIKLDSHLSVGLKKNGNGKITVKLNRKKTESFDL